MKKTIALIVIALTVTAAYLNSRPMKMEQAMKREGGPGPLSPSSLLKSALQVPDVIAPEKVQELRVVREKFRGELAKLKAVTTSYNRKVLKKRITQQDEKDYEAAVKNSLVAYEEYKQTFIKLNHEN